STWVRSSRGAHPALELTVISDCNNLHPVLGITGKVLRWPAECPTTETTGDVIDTCELRDLRLRADAADQTLHFVDLSGRVVAPCYLGLVPALNFRNALGLLLFLIDPWVCDAEAGLRRDVSQSPLPPPSGIEFYPRREVGRVVLRRARWRLPVSNVPTRRKGESEFDFFVRVQSWRDDHGLPETVFFSLERDAMELDPRLRKPIWLNFASPHSLELLRQLSAEDGRIASMTEALPAVGQHWVPAPGGDPGARTCEFISLVRWPMPETSDVRSAGEIHQERIADEDGWLYYKICPGKFDRLDDVVRRIVAPGTDAVRRSSSLRRWFFTRYIDRNGPHIRLRIRVPATHTEAVHSLLASLFDRELPALQSRDLLPFVPNAEDGFQTREWTPGWTAADYEPEYDKYGGAA